MVYESATVFPTPEGAQLTSPPPISTYGFQKLASEYFAKGALEQYGLPYTILRPFNCVGIGERRAVRDTDVMSGNVKLALSHVVPDLVLKVLKGQDPLHILGEGNQVRHYTYGGDLARGIRLAMESPAARQRGLQPVDRREHDGPRAGRDDLAQGQRAGSAVPLRVRPAVRARRPDARPGRPQGARGPRLRGHDHARRDARRGHPVDPGRGRGRADLMAGLDDVYRQPVPGGLAAPEGPDLAGDRPLPRALDRSDGARPRHRLRLRLLHPERPRGRALGHRPARRPRRAPGRRPLRPGERARPRAAPPGRHVRDRLHEQLPRAPPRARGGHRAARGRPSPAPARRPADRPPAEHPARRRRLLGLHRPPRRADRPQPGRGRRPGRPPRGPAHPGVPALLDEEPAAEPPAPRPGLPAVPARLAGPRPPDAVRRGGTDDDGDARERPTAGLVRRLAIPLLGAAISVAAIVVALQGIDLGADARPARRRPTRARWRSPRVALVVQLGVRSARAGRCFCRAGPAGRVPAATARPDRPRSAISATPSCRPVSATRSGRSSSAGARRSRRRARSGRSSSSGPSTR